MSPSNPEWYEELQGHPLRTNAFTEQLAWRIREGAGAGVRRRGRGWLRYASYSTAFLAAAIILLFTFKGHEETPAAPSVGRAITTPLVMPSPIAGVKYPPAVESYLSKPEPTDEEWQSILSANTTFVPGKRFIGREEYEEGRTFVLWKVVNASKGNESISLGIDMWEWDDTEQVWKYDQALSSSILKQQGVFYQAGNYAENYEFQPKKDFVIMDNWGMGGENGNLYPISLGIIVDPRIVQLRAVDPGNGLPIPLQLMENDGETYWFGLLPGVGHEYKLEGIDADGKVIASESRYYYY